MALSVRTKTKFGDQRERVFRLMYIMKVAALFIAIAQTPCMMNMIIRGNNDPRRKGDVILWALSVVIVMHLNDWI